MKGASEQALIERRGLAIVLVLALVGLGLSVELTHVHYNAHTIGGGKSFCAINQKVDCDAVALSPYSVFARVPVSVWGAYGYVGFLIFSVWGLRSRRPGWPYGVLAGLAVVAVAATAIMGSLSALRVKQICILCIAQYVVNIALAVTLLVILFRQKRNPVRAFMTDVARLLKPPRQMGMLVVGFGAVAAVLMWRFPHFYRYLEPLRPVSQQMSVGLKLNRPDQPLNPTSDNPNPSGEERAVDLTHCAATGADNPSVVIVEITDFGCPFCRITHQNVSALMKRYPDQIRLIHVHFPLDIACNPILAQQMHPGACEAAYAAVCAGEQGKQFEFGDLAFANQRKLSAKLLRSIAQKLHLDMGEFEVCMKSKRPVAVVKRDMAEANKIPITATPTLIIQNQLYMGAMKLEKLEEIVAPHVGRKRPP